MRKPWVFGRFLGVLKWNIGLKWVRHGKIIEIYGNCSQSKKCVILEAPIKQLDCIEYKFFKKALFRAISLKTVPANML